ncbi:MAG TPA: hypothetical protein DEO32_02135 [Ruminococcaceae bacterium]|nr:hypothetical protein [Oscillospiraceae bacterium]
MKLAKMRFKGVAWLHNPRELSFDCEKYISENGSHTGRSYIQSTGRKNMIIRGKGELFGDDCLEQFRRLFELFREGGSGILSIAGLSPVHAVFESLTITALPKPDLLEYEFVFREVMEKKHSLSPVSYVLGEGECLWDVSYIFGVAIEDLLELNPSFKRPDEVIAGKAVKLC